MNFHKEATPYIQGIESLCLIVGQDKKAPFNGAELVYLNSDFTQNYLEIGISINKAKHKKEGYRLSLTLLFTHVSSFTHSFIDKRSITDLSISACNGHVVCIFAGIDLIVESKSLEFRHHYGLELDNEAEKIQNQSFKKKYVDEQLHRFKIKETALKKEGFVLDCSFNGVEAPHHLMYKLPPLMFHNDSIKYEFLIEFDKKDATIGIYYGVRALFPGDNTYKSIETIKKDFINLKPLIVKLLEHEFPGCNYERRLLPTDNANDMTFWPFWIRLGEDEELMKYAAKPTKLIRDIYEIYSRIQFPEHLLKEDIKKIEDQLIIISGTKLFDCGILPFTDHAVAKHVEKYILENPVKDGIDPKLHFFTLFMVLHAMCFKRKALLPKFVTYINHFLPNVLKNDFITFVYNQQKKGGVDMYDILLKSSTNASSKMFRILDKLYPSREEAYYRQITKISAKMIEDLSKIIGDY